MKYESTDLGFTFTRDDGEKVKFAPDEITFILHEIEKRQWEGSIYNAIDLADGCIDFDSMTEEEFKQYCMDELQSKYECQTLESNPDFDELVFDIAQENGMWRNG